MTVTLFPDGVPGPAAARELNGWLCVAQVVGSVVHWRRPAPPAWPACQPLPAAAGVWRLPDDLYEVAACWLCSACGELAGLRPRDVEMSAAELATVHAHDVRRADDLLTPDARLRARAAARSAAIFDMSLVAHVAALIERRPPVWPVDVADIPTAEEVYGPALRMPWQGPPRRFGRRRPTAADFNPRSWSTR